MQLHEMLNIEIDKVSNKDAAKRVGRRSASLVSADERPGWPLLGRASSFAGHELKRKTQSVVEWAMSLPDRSMQSSPLPTPQEPGLSKHRRIAYKELEEAVSDFHEDNMIGNGGSNQVYRGILRGKKVAVRIQKSTEDARKEFNLEVDIVSSLQHANIASLVGVCLEEKKLISVYDYMPKGTLQENLNKKPSLSWEVRFNIAVEVAEAVNYLHRKCPKAVIHRDIKSSNILLSDTLRPKLSDFGLAIWKPTGSSHNDAVGTFGYIAPEYFMYGKLSEKIDVYAYGVVLLELLSGRKPIDDTGPNGSLVVWAFQLLEKKNFRAILDPDLRGKFNARQLKRMAAAAMLCLCRSPRNRPKMDMILKLLRGEIPVDAWQWCQEDDIDDDVQPWFRKGFHYPRAQLELEDGCLSR